MNMLRTLTLCGVASGVMLSGCSVIPTYAKVDVLEPTQARPSAAALVPASNGSLFQPTGYRPMYETHRARMVGDIITVNISENIAAKQKSTSNIEKVDSVGVTANTLPFLNAAQVAKANADVKTSNKFDGKGTTESAHNFSGTITATVIEVLPNGHLIISGEKQIGVNANVELLRFSGQIDPMTIQPGNSVASSQIANVRIEQRGRGGQADAQEIGWLAHFFLSVLPI